MYLVWLPFSTRPEAARLSLCRGWGGLYQRLYVSGSHSRDARWKVGAKDFPDPLKGASRVFKARRCHIVERYFTHEYSMIQNLPTKSVRQFSPVSQILRQAVHF